MGNNKSSKEEECNSKNKKDSYYKIIDGVKYDRELMEFTQNLIKGQGDGRLSLDDVKKIWNDALDKNKITPIERQTLQYIYKTFVKTDIADTLFLKLLAGVVAV